MWLVEVSIASGWRAAGAVAQAIARGTQVRAAFDHAAWDVGAGLVGVVACLRGLDARVQGRLQHGEIAEPAPEVAYKSLVHSQTLPVMSYSP